MKKKNMYSHSVKQWNPLLVVISTANTATPHSGGKQRGKRRIV